MGPRERGWSSFPVNYFSTYNKVEESILKQTQFCFDLSEQRTPSFTVNQYCSCTAILEGFVASYYGSWGWEDPLEEGRAAHSSVLAWRIPGTVEPGGLLSLGSHRVGHD